MTREEHKAKQAELRKATKQRGWVMPGGGQLSTIQGKDYSGRTYSKDSSGVVRKVSEDDQS